MKLDLQSLFELAGGSLAAEGDVDLSTVKVWARYPFTRPIAVQAQASNSAGVVTLRLLASFELELQCDRCLAPFTEKFSPEFQHIVVARVYGEDDGSFVIAQDGIVDVDELFSADVLLEMPGKVLCREDCRGLCSKCGHNLNEGGCGCTHQEIDPRLSVLDSFFN